MSEPLDEDAPLVASVAADAVKLLQDATAGSVGYPGLSVGSATRRTSSVSSPAWPSSCRTPWLTLSATSTSRRSSTSSSRPRQPRPPSQTINTAQEALDDVPAAAADMTRLLNVAEPAMLEVKPAS